MPPPRARRIRTLASSNTNSTTNNRHIGAGDATNDSTPTGATTDSTSRRRTRSSTSGGGGNSDFTDGSTSSIRDGSRISTRSRGNHDGRMYNVNYRHSLSQQSYPTCEGGGACGNRAQCDVCDRERICICRQYRSATKCKNCKLSATPPVICGFHQIITCTHDDCDDCYHVGCIASSQHLSLEEYNAGNFAATFVCYRCINIHDSAIESSPWSSLAGARGNDDRIKRCGMSVIPTTGISRRSYIKNIKAAGVAFSEIQQTNNNNSEQINLLDTTPRPFSSMVHMEEEAKEQHALLGRRFEMSLVSFNVNRCSCCGVVKPQHNDVLLFPTESPMEQKTLISHKMHPAVHCTCNGICKGSQFYSVNKPTQIKWYIDHHNGRLPSEVMHFPPNSVNAELCTMCDAEISNTKVDDLKFARSFSCRNGFGPVPMPPLSVQELFSELWKFQQLHHLLSNLTGAEEAAIRMIAPLVSIVSLKHTSLGMKGNVSCVWQNSKLGRVLPNIPADCKHIFLRHQQQQQQSNGPSTTSIRCTKFLRVTIMTVLRLLKFSCPPWTEMEFSQANLDKWPESGDLCDLVDGVIIIDVPDPTAEEEPDVAPRASAGSMPAQDSSFLSTQPIVNSDGADEGPAPLQNSVVPDETYEVIVNIGDRSSTGTTAASSAAAQVNAIVNNIRGDGVPATPIPIINEQESAAIFNREDVLHLDGFVNMTTTPFSWSMAFPTVYIPSYVNFQGEWKWMIFQDISGSHFTREKKVTMKQWMHHQSWRSDGVPSAHPTWSIVLYSYKIQTALQQQGSYSMSTAEIDPSTTLQEISAPTSEASLKKAVSVLLKNARMHSSNIPGTTPYWHTTRYEMKAIHFYNSYINDEHLSIFHTGSLAEYHEPALRQMLYNYTRKLDNKTEEEAREILDDDRTFFLAIQKYKNIVTHYLASKMEIWFGTFFCVLFDVKNISLTFEFAKTRGAIHFHSLLGSKGEFVKFLQAVLKELALSIHYALQTVNQWIDCKWETLDEPQRLRWLRSKHSKPTSVIDNKIGEKVRMEFCSKYDELLTHAMDIYSTPSVSKIWSEYEEKKLQAINVANEKVGKIMESKFGVHAMHLGQFPQEWVKPGGWPMEPYPITQTDMLTSKQVLDIGELRQFKHQLENIFLGRQVKVGKSLCQPAWHER